MPRCASPDPLSLRRDLRRRATEAERRLWAILRGRGLGVKFRRQHPIGPYVLDFFCPEHRLAIELDGGQHRYGSEPWRDAIRSEFLAKHGIRVVRFTNREWFDDPDGVMRAIWREIGVSE